MPDIKHTKVSAIPDDTDTSVVRPSDWNAAHTIEAGSIPVASLVDPPGGELGGTWASPTVDATHSGSTHAATQTAAEATAASALTTHAATSHPPISADYLVGTAHAGLSAEIVVGTTPGGELGGTWDSPTVDATHSGSTHAATQAAAESTAATALAAHESDITSAHKLDDLAAPDDNTDLNASTTKHGLLRKLDNTATNYLDGTGAWSVPAGGGGAPTDADYLVGTAHAGLSGEIVVGTTPGGELGGTWGSPTVDATHAGSAHHAQAHGAADHTDRTREIFLNLNGASTAGGSPVQSALGGPSVYSGWLFDAALTERITTKFLVPADWASGALTFKLYWTNAGAGSGNVVWNVFAEAVSDTETLDVNGTNIDNETTIAAPVQHILKTSTWATTLTPTAGELISLRLSRMGADAADTLANDAALIGVEVEYTSDE